MLAFMRKYAYSWGIRIILGLIIAIFAFWGVGTGFFATVHPVASVNHRQILADQVDSQAERLRARMQQIYGDNAQLVLKGINLREQALEMLIEQQLVDIEAHRIGLHISAAVLEQDIASQPVFQVNGHFDFRTYEEVLRNNRLEPAEYEALQRTALLAQTLQKMVNAGVQVSDIEARREFDLRNQQIALSYFEIPYDHFAAAIHPTPQQIQQYYRDHGEEFREPEQVKIEYVNYDPMKLAAATPLREVDIQSYYGDNQKTLFTHPEQVRVRHILIEVPKDASAADKAVAKRKAEGLLDQIKHGADFSRLAKENSGDIATRESGGELGFFGRGQMIKPFEDAAFALQPGQYAIVETQYGFHVIQLEAKTPAHMDTLAQARPAIVAALKQKNGAEIAKRSISQDLPAALGGKNLDQLAQKRGLETVTTPLFAADQHLPGLGDNPSLIREVFAMRKGDVRVITGGAAPMLVKLIDRNPAHIPPLNQIEARVSDTYVRSVATTQAGAQAHTLLAKIKNVTDFKPVATQNGFEVYTTPEFPRSSRSVPGIGDFPEVTDAAALIPKVPGVIAQPMEHDGNYYLFMLASRSLPTDQEWAAAASKFKPQMLEANRAQAWGSFLQELKAHADITIDPNQIGASQTSSSM
ncbi:MAG: SurA N-terminal domain-containing protein [Candidatus Binataceae bacterium]|nr:SurA N-terminal domain-containing protein [Candidatus Binataceae bacterium]